MELTTCPDPVTGKIRSIEAKNQLVNQRSLIVSAVVVALLILSSIQTAIFPSTSISKAERAEAASLPAASPVPILEFLFESSNTAKNTGTVVFGPVPSPTPQTLVAMSSTDVPPPCASSLHSLALQNGSQNGFLKIPKFINNSYVFNYTSHGAPGSSGNKVTVEAWVKPILSGSSGQLMVIWDDYGQPGVLLGVWGNGVVHFNVKTTTDTSLLGAFNDNARVISNYWQHLAGVYDGNQLHVFVNGQESCPAVNQSGPIKDYVTGDYATIGAGNPNGAGLQFYGLIDDVRIYSAALDRKQLANGCFKDVPPIACCNNPVAR